MTESIQAWVENITVYMIFVTLLYKLNVNRTFQPYLKLITGLLMIVLLMEPVMKVCSVDFSEVFQQEMGRFQVESMRISQDIYQEKSKEMILASYETQLRKMLEAELSGYGLYLQKMEVTFNKSESYGEIESISMEVSYQQDFAEKQQDSGEQESLTKIRELKLKQWLKENYQVEEEKVEIKLKK